jgi:hypothetical protein
VKVHTAEPGQVEGAALEDSAVSSRHYKIRFSGGEHTQEFGRVEFLRLVDLETGFKGNLLDGRIGEHQSSPGRARRLRDYAGYPVLAGKQPPEAGHCE